MANQFLMLTVLLLEMIVPFVATLGLFILIFSTFPTRDFEPRPRANKLQLIGSLLIVVPSILSLLLRLAIA
jgi:hypothetical protein